ncbi:hypothetical protein [Leptospira borgpetersenii]|uniref:hypothetical protein n=2 Tax=Leptospira TaxID=171 RepID=UPI00034DD33D|nr:hypothetical protein [Leptospira borgpetersenii]
MNSLLIKSKLTGPELAEIKMKIEGELEDFPDEETFVRFCKQSYGWSRRNALGAMQDFLDVKVKARYNLI